MKFKVVDGLMTAVIVLSIGHKLRAAVLMQEDLQTALKMARSTDIDQYKRQKVAQTALTFIREEAAKELNLVKTADLYSSFIKNPQLVDRLGLNDTKGLAATLTEFNLLTKQMRSEKAVQACYGYKKDLPVRVLEGMENYDPLSEGGWYHSYAEVKGVVWKNNQQQESSTGPLPLFALSPDFAVVLSSDRRINYDKKNENSQTTLFNPSLQTIKDQNPDLKSEEDHISLLVMNNLRRLTYERAVLNAVINLAVLDYRYSSVKSGSYIDFFKITVPRLLNDKCKYCSKEVKETLALRAVNKIKSTIKNKNITFYKSKKSIAQGLCAELFKADYPYDSDIRYVEAQKMAASLDSVEMAKGIVALRLLDDKRRQILQALSFNYDSDTVLLGTEALSKLKGNQPQKTYLSCKGADLLEEEVPKIESAVLELNQNNEKFLKDLHESIEPTNFRLAQLNQEFKKLLVVASKSVGEAMISISTTGYDKFVCSMITAVNEDDARKQGLHDLLEAGQLSLVALLTAATAGATTPLLFVSGTVAGVGTSVAYAEYSFRQARVARELMDHYRAAAIAQGMDLKILNLSDAEYKKYKSNMLAGYLNYGAGFLEASASVFSLALRNGKSFRQATKEIESIVDETKESVAIKQMDNIVQQAKPAHPHENFFENFVRSAGINNVNKKLDLLDDNTLDMIAAFDDAAEAAKLRVNILTTTHDAAKASGQIEIVPEYLLKEAEKVKNLIDFNSEMLLKELEIAKITASDAAKTKQAVQLIKDKLSKYTMEINKAAENLNNSKIMSNREHLIGIFGDRYIWSGFNKEAILPSGLKMEEFQQLYKNFMYYATKCAERTRYLEQAVETHRSLISELMQLDKAQLAKLKSISDYLELSVKYPSNSVGYQRALIEQSQNDLMHLIFNREVLYRKGTRSIDLDAIMARYNRLAEQWGDKGLRSPSSSQQKSKKQKIKNKKII